MMKNSKKFLSAAVLLTILITTSCENFLDRQPISEETTVNGYSTASQLEAALTGSYESFQSSQYYVWDHIIFQDVRTDNNYAGGDNPEIFAFDLNNVTPINSRILTDWGNTYNAIAKANLVIEKAPEIEDRSLTETRRNQIIGEALFLRAFHYFTLVKMFGDIPITLQLINSVDPSTTRLSRSPVDAVYNQIISDLTLAIDSLPNSYQGGPSVNKARATAGAANALLAKVYMQMPIPDYDKAIEHADRVINSPAGYQLMGSYAQLFDGNNYNNAESIIEIQFLGGPEGNFGPQLHLPPSISGDAWRKFVTPSHDLVDAYDAQGDDIRKNASILFESVSYIDEYWGNSPGSSIPFAYKWKNAGGFASADHTYLMRLADIILLKAEALNAKGDIGSAALAVNQVRNRVNLDDLTSADMASQETMRDAILLERRLEFAMEGHRWDDLVRNGILIETMNNLVEIDLRTGQPVNYNFNVNDLLLPIPQGELNRNPNLTQNPGY